MKNQFIFSALFSTTLGAQKNAVDIDVWGNNDYFGSIYTGSEYEKNYVIFDTTSDWTVIMDNKADGIEITSEYDLS